MTRVGPERPGVPGRNLGGALIGNAAALIATSAVTSGLGFVFWWAAARLLPPEVIGQGTALISVMTLLGTLAMLGVGSMLISELPGLRTRGPAVLSAGLLSVAGTSGLIAILAAPVLSHLLPHLAQAVSTPWLGTLFVTGVVLTTISLVFDQAVIGLLNGPLQLRRNLIAALIRVAALALFARLVPHPQAIFSTWTAATAVSLLAVGLARADGRAMLARPAWRTLRRLAPSALRHHLLNLAMQAPGLIMPVLVATQVSARENAQFYLAWLIAGFLGMIPYSLAAVLPALQTQSFQTQPLSGPSGRMRSSLRWSLLGCGIGVTCLMLLAEPLMSLFGASYQGGVPALQLLSLTAFPVIVKAHYVALGRLEDRMMQVAGVVAASGLLELLAVWISGRVGGLSGMAAGLLGAYLLGAVFMLPAVLKSAGRGQKTVVLP